MKGPCRKCAPKANSRPLLILVNNPKQYVLVCHPYVTRMYLYVIRISLVCTCMSSVCHLYVLVCHLYVTRMYSYVIRMPLICTRMSSVCNLYVLVCHSYVTRLWFYHERNCSSFCSVIDAFYF